MSFEFRNAEEVRNVLKRHGVRYLFFGKSGAILLGYSDTTQDVDLFVEKQRANCEKLVTSLHDLGFPLTDQQVQDIVRSKVFIQLRNGPFDLDLLFAPDGNERFDDAWQRHVERHGFPVADIDDIIASKKAANRQRDRESLPRMLKFREWLKKNPL
jgi:predicted nucleotidyltransferase